LVSVGAFFMQFFIVALVDNDSVPHDSPLVQQSVEIVLKTHHIIGLSIPMIIALS